MATYENFTSFKVTLTTQNDCALRRLSFDLLLYYPSILTSQNFYYLGSTTLFDSSDTAATDYSKTISNYNTTLFILGLRMLSGLSVSSFGLKFGWELVLSLNQDTATVLIEKTNIEHIGYSYFQIGELTNSPNTDGDQQTDNQGSSSNIGIVMGTVIAILTIVVIVLLAIRFCPRKQQYVVPHRDDFRSLPSLTF